MKVNNSYYLEIKIKSTIIYLYYYDYLVVKSDIFYLRSGI